LFIQLSLSVIVSLIYFSSNDIAIIVILSLFGYIFSSIDLIYITEFLIKHIKSTSINKNSVVVPVTTNNKQENQNINDNKGRAFVHSILKYFINHLIMIVLTLTCSIVPYLLIINSNYSINSIYQIQSILLYICIGLFLVCKILADLNSVYIFFGLIRNPFYPINCISSMNLIQSAKSINQKRMFFIIIKYLRLILIKIIAPLVMCAVVSLDCSINKTYQNNDQNYWRIICILRVFRWVIKNFLFYFFTSFNIQITIKCRFGNQRFYVYSKCL
jgi:hypothetical protein